ncbi:hypothetical protein FVEG_03069 [Fusarium verticillioides 7600]|uniref:Uncharacterized protein n=1 Tax=Gibberella moniliformis (strain M3125 / FGSC 7600) TaxID=334819 RepID=W7LQJ1_GIBM7|nr:hypothetical protein FVEG_03069 [Fusarium verticillioides 7600]EWG40796.1 hypothetical protein FVEG_03069 [Fusarium verticillioides 7600]
MSIVMNHIKGFLSGNSMTNSSNQYYSTSEKNPNSYQLQTASHNDPTPPPQYSSEPTCGQHTPKPVILEFQRPSQEGYRISRPEGRNGQRFLYRHD